MHAVFALSDVNPSKCLYAGECILGDLGSASELGKHSHEHTPTHWPVEFEDPDVSVHETSVAIACCDFVGAHRSLGLDRLSHHYQVS